MNTIGFAQIKRNTLKWTDKMVRYQNHLGFIITYLKMKTIPKGFRLKFHNNMEFDTSTILKNCSIKLMKRTVSFYKNRISDLQKQIRKNMEIVSSSYSDHKNEIDTMITTKTQKLNEKMRLRRKNKFESDGLDVAKAIEISEKKIKEISNGEHGPKTSKKKKEREDILKDVEIPSHDPIVLTSNPKFQDPSFKSLCAKGPSFVPTPTSVNWSQLQEDFDKFSNLIRREIFFAKNPPTATILKSDDGPPHQPSSWQAPKTNIQDAEAFLKCVERDLFADTSKKEVRSNLSEKEMEMLKFCRSEVLFNPDSTEVLRLQDKGNKIVVVDKPMDIQKSESQIAKSSIVKVDDDPTELMIGAKNGPKMAIYLKNGLHLSSTKTQNQQKIAPFTKLIKVELRFACSHPVVVQQRKIYPFTLKNNVVVWPKS